MFAFFCEIPVYVTFSASATIQTKTYKLYVPENSFLKLIIHKVQRILDLTDREYFDTQK